MAGLIGLEKRSPGNRGLPGPDQFDAGLYASNLYPLREGSGEWLALSKLELWESWKFRIIAMNLY